jgi:hypothetical protein
MGEQGKKTYRVKARIKHDFFEYEIGSTIQLDEATAAQMPWAVELISEERPKQQQEK